LRAIFNLLFYPLRHPLKSLPVYGLLLILLAGMAVYVYFPDILPAGKLFTPTAVEKEKKAGTFSIPTPAPASPSKSSQEVVSAPTTTAAAKNPAPDVVEKSVQRLSATTVAEEPAMSPAELESYLNRTFTIRFQMDSNEFSDDAYDLLNRIAHAIKQKPGLKVSVSGYTDSLGNYDYNRRLSEFRATVVKSYLVGQGVLPAQIAAYGKGPENPVESNETLKGRAANRRVEIILSK